MRSRKRSHKHPAQATAVTNPETGKHKASVRSICLTEKEKPPTSTPSMRPHNPGEKATRTVPAAYDTAKAHSNATNLKCRLTNNTVSPHNIGNETPSCIHPARKATETDTNKKNLPATRL
ncbi:hypothetical protein, partial [uncultured Muribaculum sp.]|uniref:hypothetical protein n=1 Tax=uncultured Muribaculum sp. TaxID=1918613 RepID=UPI00261E3C26